MQDICAHNISLKNRGNTGPLFLNKNKAQSCFFQHEPIISAIADRRHFVRAKVPDISFLLLILLC